MNDDYLDVPCNHCYRPANDPCVTPQGQPRGPHAKRKRTYWRAEPHMPPQVHDGYPVAIPLELSEPHTLLGNRTVTVLCPECWQLHYHGWIGPVEDGDYSHRAPHCSPSLVPISRGYLIPPTAHLPRTGGQS